MLYELICLRILLSADRTHAHHEKNPLQGMHWPGAKVRQSADRRHRIPNVQSLGSWVITVLFACIYEPARIASVMHVRANSFTPTAHTKGLFSWHSVALVFLSLSVCLWRASIKDEGKTLDRPRERTSSTAFQTAALKVSSPGEEIIIMALLTLTI